MVIETGIVTFAAATVGSLVVWSIRQEGRINGHDAMFEEREKHNLAVNADLKSRLERIENKLDRLPWSMSTKI